MLKLIVLAFMVGWLVYVAPALGLPKEHCTEVRKVANSAYTFKGIGMSYAEAEWFLSFYIEKTIREHGVSVFHYLPNMQQLAIRWVYTDNEQPEIIYQSCLRTKEPNHE